MTDEEREDLNTFRHELVKQARWWKWKAEALEKDKAKLESENASLRARLDKAVELKEPHWELCPYSGMYIVYYKAIVPKSEAYDDRAAAEARLAELKEKK